MSFHLRDKFFLSHFKGKMRKCDQHNYDNKRKIKRDKQREKFSFLKFLSIICQINVFRDTFDSTSCADF